MAKYDPEVANSSGYFKDPITKEDLSVDMPRVTGPTEEEWVWPQVTASDGSVIKIVYKYFTDFEKQCYKAYRARGNASSSGEKVKQAVKKEVKQITEKETLQLDPATGEVIHVKQEKEAEPEPVKYSEESACTPATQAIIANCDRLIGCSQIAGITYALLTCGSSKTIYHIPRSLIKDSDFDRLNQGA